MSDCKQAAIDYVTKLKFAVVPVHYVKERTPLGEPVCTCEKAAACPSVGKHPMVVSWTTEPARNAGDVETYWELAPRANVGIVCGSASNDGSGDLLVLDVDTDKGGQESFERLFAAPPGELRIVPPTRRTTTGGGGFHLFYRLPPGVHMISRPLKKYPGIDVRADKGQVVAPPSVSGKGSYTTDDDPTDKVGRIPPWLLDLLVEDAKTSVTADLSTPAATGEPVEFDSLPPGLAARLSVAGTPKGVRSEKFYNLVCDAREAGLTEGQAVTVVTAWCRSCDPPLYPGKEAHEIHRAWAKHEARQRAREIDVPEYRPGGFNVTSLAYAPDPAPVDPVAVEETRAAFHEALEQPHEGLDLDLLTRRLGDLDELAARVSSHTMVDWEALLTKPLPPPDWILPDVMERGQFVCIYAPEGHGKSLLMQQQMGAAVAGRIVAGGELSAPATVLYLDQENNRRNLHARYLAGEFKHEELARLHYCLADGMPYLHTPAGARELLGLVVKYQPDVVVLDTFTRFVEGEQNAPEAPNAFFRYVAKPLTDAGITVVVLDHTAKDRHVRGPIGSRAKTATPHLVWRMEKLENDPNTLLLTLEKDRDGNCPPYLRVHKKSLPLDFEFEPLTKEEYEQEKAVGRLGGDGDKPKRGPVRKDDDEKIDALAAKLDAAGVRVEATWTEACTGLHGAGVTFDRKFLKRALRRRAGDEWDDQ